METNSSDPMNTIDAKLINTVAWKINFIINLNFIAAGILFVGMALLGFLRSL